MVAYNLSGIPSPMTNAVLIDGGTNSALLQYSDVESNGNANINCRNGTLRFWFKPDWTSGSAGSNNWGWLVEVGNYNPGSSNSWWGLYLSPDRSQLWFNAASNGASATYLVVTNLGWVSNQWNQVVLTYSPTSSALYLNLQLAAQGPGVNYYPNVQQRAASGFRLGSDANGNNQAQGAFDELETFNYPLNINNVDAAVANAANISALAAAGGSAPVSPPCLPFYSAWMPYIYPSTSSSYTAPEPTVTNETVNINSVVTTRPGLVYRVQIGPFCYRFQPIQYASWGVSGQILDWTAFYLPFQSAFASGAANGPATSGEITYIPTKASDEKVMLDVAAISGFPLAGQHAPTYSPNPFSVPLAVFPQQRLLYLSFNSPSLAGEGGQLPISATGITQVATPFGQGVNIPGTGSVNLVYPAFQNDGFSLTEPDGSIATSCGTPNIRRNRGTVRFWFKPNWTSGSGPANGVFLDMTGAGWTLTLSWGGTQIGLYSGNSQLVTANVNWTDPTIWHQIAVTYTQTKTVLYVDGVATTGSAISSILYNPLTTFRIGSDSTGASQINGVVDELETFNYDFTATQIQSDYSAAVNLDANGDGIADLLEFEEGIDPFNPPAQNPIINPPPTSGDTTPPVVQLLQPIGVQ